VTTSTAAAVDPLATWRAAFAEAVAGVDAPVVVACSGRADSVALLALAVDAALAPVAVHVDHSLRPGSDTEVEHVRAIASQLGAQFRAARVEIDAGPNLEARARDARYAALGLPVFDDPMNDDRTFRRVAIRHDVLPLLSALAERDLVPVLARQADILRSDSEFLDELARAAWPGDGPARAAVLAALPPPLARRAVRQWVGAPPPSVAEVERVLAVAAEAARATELAGRRAVRRASGILTLTVG